MMQRIVLQIGRAFHGDEHAQMGITMLISLGIVFMFFALAMDAGAWYFDHRLAQNQADAAALAAVQELPADADTAARAAAEQWLGYNHSSAAEMSCFQATNDVENAFNTAQLDTVRVCVRRQSLTIFSQLSGISQLFVSAAAKARIVDLPIEYAMMAMDPDGCRTFEVGGGADIAVTGGGTYTASDGLTCPGNQEPLYVGGSSTLTAGTANDVVTGDGQCEGGPPALTPACTGQESIEDPYATDPPAPPVHFGLSPLTSCPVGGSPNYDVPDGVLGNEAPGPGQWHTTNALGNPIREYCQQVRIGGNVTLKENAVYILHQGLRVNAGANVTVENGGDVLFYDTMQPDAYTTAENIVINAGANFAAKGHSNYREMLFFVDRSSAGNPQVTLSGNSLGTIEGRIYNIRGDVTVQGTNGTTVSLNINIVANTIHVTGDANINFVWNQDLAPTRAVMALIE